MIFLSSEVNSIDFKIKRILITIKDGPSQVLFDFLWEISFHLYFPKGMNRNGGDFLYLINHDSPPTVNVSSFRENFRFKDF